MPGTRSEPTIFNRRLSKLVAMKSCLLALFQGLIGACFKALFANGFTASCHPHGFMKLNLKPYYQSRARTAGTLSEKIKIYGYMMDVFIRYVCVRVKSRPKGSIVEMALKVGGTFKANCY